MDRLDDLEAFLASVEQGSQTAAAKQLRRSLQAINRSLVSLFRRRCRSRRRACSPMCWRHA
jgi:DNA-binding transcriptional LysR family regulator